jgi:hypothetical protein
MPSAPIFEAVWARCLQHKTLLEPGEDKCLKCKIRERDLSLIPPFQVYCTASEWGEAKIGETYEVEWVIKQARRSYGESTGYAFKFNSESVNDHIFDSDNFIPYEFLTEENKDSWLIGESSKPDIHPVITDEDFYGGM